MAGSVSDRIVQVTLRIDSKEKVDHREVAKSLREVGKRLGIPITVWTNVKGEIVLEAPEDQLPELLEKCPN